MKNNSQTSLQKALFHAILSYDEHSPEEQGGFILKEVRKDNYEFVKVTNQNTGTGLAYGLYTADTKEFNNKVALRTFDDKWEIYASFHTHPKGMRALPSNKDITALFTNFPINYIYAFDAELNRYDFEVCSPGKQRVWRRTNVMAFNGFNAGVKAGTWKAVDELNKLNGKRYNE